MSDANVRQVLEPYAHIQVWWDADPEQKAFSNSLSKPRFPTLVFLDQNGQAAYTSSGYKKPEAFMAECVKASDLLGVAVPAEARAIAAGQTAKGAVVDRTAGLPGNNSAGSTQNDPFKQSPPRSPGKAADDSKASLFPGFSTALLKDKEPESRAPYSPLKEACFDINTGKLEKGIAILNEFLPGNTRNAEAHYLLAAAYVMSRKYALAAEQYRLVIKLEPNSPLGNRARAGLQKIGMVPIVKP